jgi:hypothetical protein
VYSSAFSGTTNAAAGIWFCDNVSDEVQINAALASTRGKVQLIGANFRISSAITLPTGMWLCGEGLGTMITAALGFGTGMITLLDQGTHATTLSDLTIDGNGQGVTAGVHYSLTGGQIFTSAPATNPDPAHIITRLNIINIGNGTVAGHGMRMSGGNLRAGKYSDIRILNASACGVWVDNSVDSHYTNIEIGSSGDPSLTYSTLSTAPVGHGFFVSGNNNMFTACKGWYSRGAGFYNRGVRNGFTNCQAQDNHSHGFDIVFGKSTFIGCHADSNGQGLGVNGLGTAGFRIATELLSIVGCQSYDRGGQAWKQATGFLFTGGATYSRITACTTYANATASQSGTAGIGTAVDIQGDVNGK